MTAETIGFIGGGQMARALCAGAIEAGIVKPPQLVIAEPNELQQSQLRERLGDVVIHDSGAEVLASCDRIVLAVKPQVLKQLAVHLRSGVDTRHLLVSIAAGITLSQLQQMLGTQRIVRVMPNTPAQVRAGAAGVSADHGVTPDDLNWVMQLMNAVGMAVQVPDVLQHAVTGLAGSGPAYVYLIIEALSDAGVAQGLPRELSTRLAAQTVLGAAKMVIKTGKHPGELKDQVTSPAGTTIAGLRQLERDGMRSALIEAVAKATKRSIELGG